MKEDGYFLAMGPFGLQSLLIANGAKVINAVNFYPDLKKWKLIDPNNKYKHIWNRYYHVDIELTDKKTKYVLMQCDYFKIKLNVLDLKKWPVKYIISSTNIDDILKKGFIKYKKKLVDNYYIYILDIDK